jgi:hypothetical protein
MNPLDSTYIAIANSHTLQFTMAHTKSSHSSVSSPMYSASLLTFTSSCFSDCCLKTQLSRLLLLITSWCGLHRRHTSQQFFCYELGCLSHYLATAVVSCFFSALLPSHESICCSILVYFLSIA